MKEYVKESEETTFHNGFGESYDKEWALTDQGKREGIEQGSITKAKEIAKAILNKNMDIKLISELTQLEIKEINSLK